PEHAAPREDEEGFLVAEMVVVREVLPPGRDLEPAAADLLRSRGRGEPLARASELRSVREVDRFDVTQIEDLRMAVGAHGRALSSVGGCPDQGTRSPLGRARGPLWPWSEAALRTPPINPCARTSRPAPGGLPARGGSA